MVEVVDAMIGLRARHCRGSPQHLTLQINDFGNTFENEGGCGKRGRRLGFSSERNACHNGRDGRFRKQPEACHVAQCCLDFGEGGGGHGGKVGRVAFFEVDQDDGVARVGKGNGDAARHPAGNRGRRLLVAASSQTVGEDCVKLACAELAQA